MEIIEPFRTYIAPGSQQKFDRDPSVIYGLTDDLRLGLLNDAWFDLARANDAPPDFFEKFSLGGSYLEGIDGPIRPFFEGHIRQSIESGEAWEFDYQCPARGRFRMFRMQVLPLGRSGGSREATEAKGCLVTNASIVEIPRPEQDVVAAEDIMATYVGADEIVTQCANCRRSRRLDQPMRWDWVPQLVWDRPARISHGICPPCDAYFEQ